MSTTSTIARGLLAFAASGLLAAPALAQIGTSTSSGTIHEAVEAESLDPRTVPEWVIEPMGAWGGPVHAFERHGDIGYVGSGQRLVVLDLSDLTDIKELGTVKLGSTVQDFKVRDGLAYVATLRLGGGTLAEMGIRNSSFHIIDLSDASKPMVVWSDATNRRFVEVDLWGNLAFLREDHGTMWAADLTDPLAPVMRSTNGIQFRNTSGNAMKLNDLEIHGDLAYMAVQESLHQFQIFDLSTITPGAWPAVPQRLGTANFFVQREARKVAIEGDWAYVLGRDDFALAGIQDEAPGEIVWAVNVSNPAAPVKHGNFAHFSDFITVSGGDKPIEDIAVSGGRVYATDAARIPYIYAWERDMGLVILDVATDPGQPTLLGSHRTHGSVRGVVADGDIAYLFDQGEGLVVMDVSDPNAVTRIGGYHSPAEIVQMAREGDRLYLADPWNGLSILDVADLAHPVLLGTYQTPERIGLNITGVAVDGEGFAYLSAGYAGMEVIDVSDPTSPSLQGAIRLPTEEWRTDGQIAVDTLADGSGKFVYITVRVPGLGPALFTIDVNDPSQPAQASPSPALIWTPISIARHAPGQFLMATGTNAFQDVDGVPASEPVISQLPFESGHRFSGVSVDGRGVVSATYMTQLAGTWFVTYDVGNVAEGAELASVEMLEHGDVTDHPLGAVALGRWAHGTPIRVTLMDLSSPSNPRALASAPVAFGSSGDASGGLRASVLADGKSALVANDQDVGLEIFRMRQQSDRNADGVINPFDYSAFLGTLQRGDRSADLNGDGFLNATDLNEFVILYRAQSKVSIIR